MKKLDNQKKNKIYRDLSTKLKKAIENTFYYEAVFIEYAIIEDRMESLMRHGLIPYHDEFGYVLSLDKKLKAIKHSRLLKDDYIAKHLTSELLESIDSWRKRRNKVIHELISANYDNENIKALALKGQDIVRILNNKSVLVNKYNDKRHAVQR